MPHFDLNAIEQRVLGALIEKEMATPEYYPLSLNALVNASNQKNNREPVMQLVETDVLNAIEIMRHKGVTYEHSGREHRVPKYSQGLGQKTESQQQRPRDPQRPPLPGPTNSR